MSKYTLLLAALCFAVVPAAMADQDPPAMHPDAAAFLTEATDFITDHSSDLGGFDQNQYITELTAIAEQIPDDADLSQFNVSQYMAGMNTSVDGMLNGTLTGNAAALRQQYLEEVANFFLKEYFKDMKDDVSGITTSDYLRDLESLNASYQSRAEGMGGSQGTSIGYNPSDYLDKAAGATNRDTQFEFLWGGIQSSWLGYNLVALVQVFQQRFAHDAVAMNDLQFLLDLWPQSAEAYMMNTAYDDGQYYISDERDNGDSSARQMSYVIDEYGKPTTEYEADEFSVGSNSTRYITQSYNNRQWGYQNGTFDMITITTNGRKYSLAENFYTSPLVLDLDNDGKIDASNGLWLPHMYQQNSTLVEFDINGDGFVELCEWVGPNDGLLLVYDAKKDYVDGNDLFGNAGGYDHGYEKLMLRDANNDNMLTETELVGLSVWQDRNTNGTIEKGEVSSVQELGITLISLDYDSNVVSHFCQNDVQKKMVDWFPTLFVIKRTE